jgi:glucokinase
MLAIAAVAWSFSSSKVHVMRRYIGLDLGGTNVKAGAVDGDGTLIHKVSRPTTRDRGADAVTAEMAEAARQAAQAAGWSMDDVSAIGIGAPGPIDFDNGVIVAMPNLDGFDHYPLRDKLAQATGRPCELENDANAAAYAEFWVGAARDPKVRHVVMLTLGTGVGTGIIMDGHIFHGAFGNGAEGGHMIVQPHGRPCGCGQRGCLETYASASHVARIVNDALDAGEASSLSRVERPVESRQIFAAAAQGDTLALRVVDQAADYLGVACVSICRLLDPQMILFAGGMTLAGDFLFDRIRVAFDRHRWNVAEDRVRIGPATLGNDAGVIGAAGVAWDALQRGRIAGGS